MAYPPGRSDAGGPGCDWLRQEWRATTECRSRGFSTERSEGLWLPFANQHAGRRDPDVELCRLGSWHERGRTVFGVEQRREKGAAIRLSASDTAPRCGRTRMRCVAQAGWRPALQYVRVNVDLVACQLERRLAADREAQRRAEFLRARRLRTEVNDQWCLRTVCHSIAVFTTLMSCLRHQLLETGRPHGGSS